MNFLSLIMFSFRQFLSFRLMKNVWKWFLPEKALRHCSIETIGFDENIRFIGNDINTDFSWCYDAIFIKLFYSGNDLNKYILHIKMILLLLGRKRISFVIKSLFWMYDQRPCHVTFSINSYSPICVPIEINHRFSMVRRSL